MKPMMKSIVMAAVAFLLGVVVTLFFWARAVVESQQEIALVLSLGNLAEHMRTVEAIEGNRSSAVIAEIDTMLCLEVQAARAAIAASHTESIYSSTVERAEARIHKLLKRESPESMPGYGYLLPCAQKDGDVANASSPKTAHAVVSN